MPPEAAPRALRGCDVLYFGSVAILSLECSFLIRSRSPLCGCVRLFSRRFGLRLGASASGSALRPPARRFRRPLASLLRRGWKMIGTISREIVFHQSCRKRQNAGSLAKHRRRGSTDLGGHLSEVEVFCAKRHGARRHTRRTALQRLCACQQRESPHDTCHPWSREANGTNQEANLVRSSLALLPRAEPPCPPVCPRSLDAVLDDTVTF